MVRARLHNRIDLLVAGRRDERYAGGAILPGECGAIDANDKIVRHTTDGTCYRVLLPLMKQKLGGTVDDAYASGDLVEFIEPLTGDVCAVMVESGTALTLDDYLTTTNSGTFRVATSSDTRLFQVLETIAGTGSGDMLIKAVRV